MNSEAERECGSCGQMTPSAGRFCIHCAATLARGCPACGTPVAAGARFCLQCGIPLTAVDSPAPAPAPAGERRLVSVLFADLVGFTTLSERRDPEEVRELLSAYFDRCRTLIHRYGGTVEKFIGDAVMAVWGSPVAREDDAERAVRAALGLSQAVTALAGELGVEELSVRAGVLTGDAAVQIGAEGEGMVLGDTVNTASRLQSIAAPGTVLVDDVTRRASEAAIAYEDAGTHPVKGREQPVRAWTALRVVAGAGGARRGAGLEAPFLGRTAELAAVIEAGEQSAAEGTVRRVTVVGEAGAGKSRLLWEFFKYLDGIEEVRFWHEGRCLSYGEGVAYWALAEMVRARAGILEEEPEDTARAKLHDTVARFVAVERERRLVEPRLAHLLRLEERPDADRADLFSGWRLFLERMAQTQPVILAFEDLQWADSGLLDFIDYLMEWSADFPIFVLALGRPELHERRAGWAPLRLDPLPAASIGEILEGLVPGLPGELAAEISHRAEGIPLYAVETVRMLQDRGLLVRDGARYTVTGDVSELEVPETLQALVASRLDGLTADERSVLQSAAVYGRSFSVAAVAALTDRRPAELSGLLDGLVAKQLLARDQDPRSPQRGQYTFLQALLRTVAYGTLGRRTRKSLHLAAARFLSDTASGDGAELAEVLASHYLEAIRADDAAADVGELRARAREALVAAGQAAASLALGSEADRYFAQAGELAADDGERARLLEDAGDALQRAGELTGAEQRLREAVALRRAAGDPTGGSAAIALAERIRLAGRNDEAIALLRPFREPGAVSDPVLLARATEGLGIGLVFAGEFDAGGELLEESMGTLEQADDRAALAGALVGYGVYMFWRRRVSSGMALTREAMLIADAHDLGTIGLRARYNLAGGMMLTDAYADSVRTLDDALALARERGDRLWEIRLRQHQIPSFAILGRWPEAAAAAEELLTPDDLGGALIAASFTVVAAGQGDERLLARCLEFARGTADSGNIDFQAAARICEAVAALHDAAPADALTLARRVMGTDGVAWEFVVLALDLAIEASIGGEPAGIEELLAWADALTPLRRSPLVRAGSARLRAELRHRAGDDAGAQREETVAIDLMRQVGARPGLTRVWLDRWRRREDAVALAEARRLCAELGAAAWLAELPVPAVTSGVA